MAYPQQQQQPRQVSALSDVYTSLMAAKQGFDDYNSYLTGQLMLEAKARQKENEKNNQPFQNDNNNETPDDGTVKGYNPDDDRRSAPRSNNRFGGGADRFPRRRF